jgi:hypothetical protein
MHSSEDCGIEGAESEFVNREEEQTERGIPMGITQSGVNYGIIDHVVRFESVSRVCLHCGKKLKKGKRVLGIITNCPQTLPHENMPGNFFLHADCVGDLEESTIGKKVDEVVQEYQTVKDFIKMYGSKWGLKCFRYGV